MNAKGRGNEVGRHLTMRPDQEKIIRKSKGELSSGQIAQKLNVDPQTALRWAKILGVGLRVYPKCRKKVEKKVLDAVGIEHMMELASKRRRMTPEGERERRNAIQCERKRNSS